MSAPGKPYDLIVVGGGAAGFFGALSLADTRPASRILILEKARAPLAKVRISGGGRCNVTHDCFDPKELSQSYPRGGQALIGAFHRFQPADTLDWFERRGVPLKAESDGRVFPVSDSSESVIRCFQEETTRLGVKLHTQMQVHRVEPAAAGFRVACASGETFECRLLLLASGGERQGFNLAAELGHEIVPPVPSLFSFHVTDPRLNGLAGVSVADVQVSLPDWNLSQRGPLLITHWGLSGPAVIRLSSWAARQLAEASYHALVRINWLPDLPAEAVDQRLRAERIAHPQRQIAAHNVFGALPERLWRQLAAHNTPDQLTWANLSNQQLVRLVSELVQGEFTMAGQTRFRDEFVTAGGVSLKQVDFRTMESRIRPGLFLAGEVLDIDGLTGGFNFQNAWTTGWIAGQACAKRLAVNAAAAGG